MSRNRKNQAVRFGPALKAVVLCILLGGSGVGYVWQKAVIDQVGQEITKREAQLRAIEDENVKLGQQLKTMRSGRVLEARIKALDLGLAMPEPSQVWRLPEPVAEEAADDESERKLAAHKNTMEMVR
jgi:cell division protein FtsB